MKIVPEGSLTYDQAFWKHEGQLSDKWTQYLDVYREELGRLIAQGRPLRLLEIGVQNGGSLQIWAKVLPPKSEIVGIDIDPRCALLPLGNDIRVIAADATDADAMAVALGTSQFDVIVDDGSHRSPDVIAAFDSCFRYLAPGGTYIIEDLHASYWASHGGGYRHAGASIEFLKALADAINADHFEEQVHSENLLSREIAALGEWIARVSFLDSIAIVQKRTVPKRTPFDRALTGVRAEIAPALDALLALPPDRLPGALAARATGHAIDMQMVAEVRKRRHEAAGLRAEITSLEEALAKAKAELENAIDKAESDVRAARDEASRAGAAASRARIERDNARLDAMQDAARTRKAMAASRSEAALARAERDAARSHVNAIERSGFWRLTSPLRTTLEQAPWLHDLGLKLLHSALGVTSSRRSVVQSIEATPAIVPAPSAQMESGVVPTVTSPAFDAVHALTSVPPPREAMRALIVPFDVMPPQMTAPRVAVMIHAYYVDQLPRITRFLDEMPGPADLFVTTDSDDKRRTIEATIENWGKGRVEVRVVPNRGRDIAPKLFGLADVYPYYDLVLHLHTKRSPHSDNGEDWFDHVLRTLIGSELVISSVIAAFSAQPKLGLVFGDHWDPIRGCLNWGYDFEVARDVAGRMGFELAHDSPLEFPSGSMFWARPAALAPLLALQLGASDFPEEVGQLDGTIAHAIERLFLRVCEHAGYAWIRVARRDDQAIADHAAVRITSASVLTEVLARQPVLLGDPALRQSTRVLHARPETWNLRTMPEFSRRPRVTLMLPTFRASSVFGGIATAHALFERVADALGPQFERRMVLTTEDRPIAATDLPGGWTFTDNEVRGDGHEAIWIPRGARAEHALAVRPNDVFFASAWWDAATAFGLCDQQAGFFGAARRLRYFVQDYEPNFAAWSASWALAEGTYHRHEQSVAIVNSQSLADHLERLGLFPGERHVFRPLWNDGLGEPDPDPSARDNLMLVYWRPSVERNVTPIVASALAQWMEQQPYAAHRWEVVAIGEHGDPVAITDWRSIRNAGKLSLAEYRALLRRAKVGLALMVSPHPSYPPLEMASFGMRVVTNSFATKDLSPLGSRVESIGDLDPRTVADALRRATEAWSIGGAGVGTFDRTRAFASPAELDALVGRISDGIRAECAD